METDFLVVGDNRMNGFTTKTTKFTKAFVFFVVNYASVTAANVQTRPASPGASRECRCVPRRGRGCS